MPTQNLPIGKIQITYIFIEVIVPETVKVVDFVPPEYVPPEYNPSVFSPVEVPPR